jgi:hypothetical protein
MSRFQWHPVTLELIFEWPWLPLKGLSIEKTCIGKLSYTISITFTHKIWGLTKDRFLSQGCHWHRCHKNRQFSSRFASRIRSHIQKGSNPYIRVLGGVVWWKKTRGRSSHVRVPLSWSSHSSWVSEKPFGIRVNYR